MNYVKLLIIFSIFIPCSYAKKSIYKTKNKKSLIQSYFKTEKKFLRKHCSGGVEQEFLELYKNYRGAGFYVPLLKDRELDTETLEKNLPKLDKKIRWIKGEIRYLKRLKHLKEEIKNLNKLEKDFEELVRLKSDFLKSHETAKKFKVQSKFKLISFKQNLYYYFKGISFLTNLDFPVNYFKLRRDYDSIPSSNKKERNNQYFNRKVYEDGAQDKNHSRSDMYLRSVLSMTLINLKPQYDFLPEFIRYDLSYLFKGTRQSLQRGLRKHQERMKEWLNRTEETKKFYTSLIKESKKKSGNKSLANMSVAKRKLVNYVYGKQADVYEFWTDQQFIHRVLFVVDTILQNEVGAIDGRDGLERIDVTQVVLNRLGNPKYNLLSSTGPVAKRLNSSTKKISYKFPWLNVLFKEGEFSFTYYFLHANVRIFCPAQNPLSVKLRKQNLDIILDKLAKPEWDFRASRYFSRASMTGRIDMTTMWDNYSPLPQRPGKEIKSSDSEYLRLSKGDYLVLDSFQSKELESFQVLQFAKRVLVYSPKKRKLYKYRDPNFFRYFSSQSL